jgi:hypothetical protein
VPDDMTLLEAGRAIRPFITELISATDDAAALDRDLAAALALADEPVAAAEVFRLLMASQPAAEWLLDFEDVGLPPALWPAGVVRGVELQGDGAILRSARYRCPAGNDYTWYRRSVAKPIEKCPTHHVLLVPDPGAAVR